MDEPKDSQENSQQAPQDPEGTLPGGGGITPPEPETYTKEQLDMAIHQALSQAGRDAKSIEVTRQALAQQKEALDKQLSEVQQWREEQDKAFLEANKDNPQAIDWYQKNKELQKQMADFNKRKLEYDADIQLAKDTKFEVTVWGIADKHKVNPDKLKELAIQFNLTTDEQINSLAENLKAVGVDKGGDDQKLKTVTSVARGASKDINSMSPDEKVNEGLRRKLKT